MVNVPGRGAPTRVLVVLLVAVGCAAAPSTDPLDDAEALVRQNSDDAPEALARAAAAADDDSERWRRIAACWFDRARAREHPEERSHALAQSATALAAASQRATPDQHVLLQRDLAALAMLTGDTYGAITHLRRYHSHRPEDASAAVALARLLLERGRALEARDVLQPLRAGLNGDGMAVLGAIYYLLDDLGEAESVLRRAVALTTDDEPRARYAYNLGLVLAAQGREREAQASYELALDLNHGHEGAERELNRARIRGWTQPEPVLDPGTPARRVPRGERWVPPGSEAAPVAAATIAPVFTLIEAAPTEVTPEDFVRKGREFLEHGDRAGALASFSEAIALSPKYAEAYLERARVQLALGELEQARSDCTSAITHDPRLAPAFHVRGQVLHAQGNASDALADYTSALELQPGFAAAYDSRGLAQVELEFVDSAVADFSKALQVDPTLVPAWRHRAAARAGLSDFSGARDDLDQALALAPEDGEALGERGAVNHRLGEHARAADDLRRGLDLLPGDHPQRPGITEQLAECLAEVTPPGNSGEPDGR